MRSIWFWRCTRTANPTVPAARSCRPAEKKMCAPITMSDMVPELLKRAIRNTRLIPWNSKAAPQYGLVDSISLSFSHPRRTPPWCACQEYALDNTTFLQKNQVRDLIFLTSSLYKALPCTTCPGAKLLSQHDYHQQVPVALCTSSFCIRGLLALYTSHRLKLARLRVIQTYQARQGYCAPRRQ